ncbi:MAG: hypothetical protein LBE56_10690 [Tannerella sp.]|jgi:hypothetical protein|nr:hypothetical protein [Tannerella sp.]
MNVQMKGFLLVCCLIFSINVSGQTAAGNPLPLKGKWSYSVADVPDGYDRGTIEFKQIDGKTAATLKNGNGTYDIKEIKQVNQQYTTVFYVDGAEVSMSFDPKPDKITGICSVDGNDIPMTLLPVKE